MFGLDNDVTCALLGGGLLASATSFNMLMTGRITGMSSLLSAVMTVKPDFRWKLTTVTAIISTALMSYNQLGRAATVTLPLLGERLSLQLFDSSPLPATTVLIGGMLVGFGVRLGSGCTSGHGLCGIPRLSKRSVAAVSVFMSVGMATATLLDKHPLIPKVDLIESLGAALSIHMPKYTPAILSILNLFTLFIWAQKPKEIKEFVNAYVTGILFAAGLMLSGMTRVSKILSFLTVNKNWDPALAFVMASGVGINLLTFNLIFKRSQPLLTKTFSIPPKGELDRRLILGAMIFGLGWGVSGTCVGPAMAISCLADNGLLSLGSIALGMTLFELSQGNLKFKRS